MPFSIACPENFHRTITTYSMGKSLNANGMRVGFILSDKHLIHTIGKIFPADVHFTPQLDQMLTRENLSSAMKSYNKFSSYYEFSRCDIRDRINRIKKELLNCGINCLRWEGSYYFVMDIEGFRGKLPNQYFVDDDNRPIEELDRAFCRATFKEFKIGLIPFSNHYFGNVAYDNFVRISVNHNDDDLKFLCDSMKNLADSCKIRSSTQL
jgi:aspartate/methionine/tyrosine aminotransferase